MLNKKNKNKQINNIRKFNSRKFINLSLIEIIENKNIKYQASLFFENIYLKEK